MKVTLPVRPAILKTQTYEPPAEGRLQKIRLDFNENTAGCSPAVIRALARLSPKQLAMYPEYESSTRRLARFFGVSVEELIIANGGDDAIRVFFDVFVEQASSILLCEPTFSMYRYYAEISGAKIQVCRYDSTMKFPFGDVLRALRKKPRVLFVANPNNPTGTLLEPDEIERLLKAATRTAVVIDEAYVEFSGVTVVPLIRKYPQLFVTRTFSKAAGLAGLRLGAIIAREDSLKTLRRAMPPYPVNVAALTAARATIRDSRRLRHYVREVKRLREWFDAELKRLGVTTYPSAGNFLLANFGPEGPRLFIRLETKGFLLRERTREIGQGFVRISIGTQQEMERLMNAIKRLR
jgi:histidinol-phosphate aminotransferase